MKHPYPSILLVCLAIVGLNFPSVARAQVQPGAIPEFVPSSPWVVGETGLSEVRGIAGLKLPCMMVNQFDNGFIMRLAGGGQNLSAMAVDFRQPIFAKGRRYGAALYTDAGFHATVQGHVSLTPLKTDLTDHEFLRYWSQTAAAMGRASADASSTP